MAIEELKRENATLKQQLMSVSEDMEKLKETSASSCVPCVKVKLPPVVSVSLSIHLNFDHYYNVYDVATCDLCLP